MPSTNYPDVLGYITGGDRLNVNIAQIALTTRPRVVRAGRPFEVILLAQNASDTDLDLKLTLHLPVQDARRQRDRFVTKTQRLVVAVKPAEVGYVVLPVATLADTAVGEGYKISVDVDVQPLRKPNRIRAAEGGGRVDFERIAPAARERIELLKGLSFSTAKGSVIGRTTIETTFSVMSGSLSKMTDLQPGWVSVAALRDLNDSRLLLHSFGDLIKLKTLPQLKREQVFKQLTTRTAELFLNADYRLGEHEANAIAKVMTLLLEYAAPIQNAHPGVAAGQYNVESLIQRDSLERVDAPELPHWMRALLRLIDHDERAAQYPLKLMEQHLYFDLLRDAVDFCFAQVDAATGVDLGNAQEKIEYREGLVKALESGVKDGAVNFSTVYLPLIMGSLLINETVLMAGEDADALPRALRAVMESRRNELTETDIPTFELMLNLLERTVQKLGHRLRE